MKHQDGLRTHNCICATYDYLTRVCKCSSIRTSNERSRPLDTTGSRPRLRAFNYYKVCVPPWKAGDAAILLSEKGLREGLSSSVYFVHCTYSYIRVLKYGAVCLVYAKLSMQTQVEHLDNLFILCDICHHDSYNKYSTIISKKSVHYFWASTFFVVLVFFGLSQKQTLLNHNISKWIRS
jgi:hypothetical protein